MKLHISSQVCTGLLVKQTPFINNRAFFSRSPSTRKTLLVRSAINNSNNKDSKPRYIASNPNLNTSGLGSSNSSFDADPSSRPIQLDPMKQFQRSWDKFTGNILYQYYLWRQDTWSDLQLLLIMNLGIFLAGSYVEGALLRSMEQSSSTDVGPFWWSSFYTVVKIVFGQDMPDPSTSSLPRQLFAATMVLAGLASFALVLALVEQVVMEVIQENVQQGSPVYETGHIVLLAWCDYEQGLEQVARVLTQICDAYGDRGGTIVVVLTPRDKLEMESLMKKALPYERRKGTRLVFRCGQALDPADLRAVSVTTASAIIISGDYDKAEAESDSQCVRAAIVVDEMVNGMGNNSTTDPYKNISASISQLESPESQSPSQTESSQQSQSSKQSSLSSSHVGTSSWWSMDDHNAYTPITTPTAGTPRIVCQVKGDEALRRLRYACASRVHPVPSKKLNARRLSMLIQQPIAALVLRRFTEQKSNSRLKFLPAAKSPQLINKPIQEVHAYLPNATVIGVYHNRSTMLNPPSSFKLSANDILIVAGSNQPAELHPIVPFKSNDWTPTATSYAQHVEAVDEKERKNTDTQPSIWYKYAGDSEVDFNATSWDALSYEHEDDSGDGALRLYELPKQYLGSTSSPVNILLCGWNGELNMDELLREMDHGRQALPPGSNVVMVNTHTEAATNLLNDLQQDQVLRYITATYIKADPISVRSLAKSIDISSFDCAVVLCDTDWQAIHESNSKIQTGSNRLRLDAITLMVQLNIRMLLEERSLPDINIVTEKITFVNCRFEDTGRLPFGITVNSAAFSARLLTMAAADPRFLQAFDELGTSCDIQVVHPLFLTQPGEKVSYVELQSRASSLSCVLLGFYAIPETGSGLNVIINPSGSIQRSELRVWNSVDGRIKLVMLTPARQLVRRGMVEEGVANALQSLSGI